MGAASEPKTLHEIAESFLRLPREGAEFGYGHGDTRRARGAAEKAWLAVLQATGAAMGRHGRAPPAGLGAPDGRQDFLEEVGRLDLATPLRAFADLLHGRYFYRGVVPEPVRMWAALDEVADDIRTVTEVTWAAHSFVACSAPFK